MKARGKHYENQACDNRRAGYAPGDRLGHHRNSGWNFLGSGDGMAPTGNLIVDAAGNFYGVTILGGAHNVGTVFELSPNGNGGWTETVLYSFGSQNGDGIQPMSGLVMDSKRNLYGTHGVWRGEPNQYGGGTFPGYWRWLDRDRHLHIRSFGQRRRTISRLRPDVRCPGKYVRYHSRRGCHA
jgi:uncharacterized repeat protein (TIGR03803 family)